MPPHHDSSNILDFSAPSKPPARPDPVYNLDEMIHSIKPFSREIVRRSRARSQVSTDSRYAFRPLVNGRKCRLGFRFARLFSIKEDERDEILAKGPSAIPPADLECLFFSAADLPIRPHHPVTTDLYSTSSIPSTPMKAIELDGHPLSGLVYNTPAYHSSVNITCITEPTSYPFLPSGVCTKETSLMITISHPQEDQTPSVEHELSCTHSPISEAVPLDMWNPYTHEWGRPRERLSKPQPDNRPVQVTLPDSSSRFVLPV